MSPGANPALAITATVWSVPEAERTEALATRPLLVLMHGRGSNEHDLASLFPLLPASAVIVSLRAPHRSETDSAGFRPTRRLFPIRSPSHRRQKRYSRFSMRSRRRGRSGCSASRRVAGWSPS